MLPDADGRMIRLRTYLIGLCAVAVFTTGGCKERTPPPDPKQQIDMPPAERSPNAINAAKASEYRIGPKPSIVTRRTA